MMSTDIGSELKGITSPVNMHIMDVPAPADPAPLGLAAFALTTFLLSAQNAHWTRGTAPFLGFAFAYGGLCQLLAGMWEFRNRNVFGATAFSTYGGFWIGLAIYVELVAPSAKTAAQANNDLAWILLAFAIFNAYMLMWSAAVNLAVMGVFLTLQVTEVILVVAGFTNNTTALHWGGYIGVVTAAVAWYASAAGVINGMRGRPVLFVGQPLLRPVNDLTVGERV